MKLKILNRIQFIVTWLLIGLIPYHISRSIYHYFKHTENDVIAGIVAIVFLIVFSFIIHLYNRSRAINDIIDFIQQKVEDNHISKQFYDTIIFPAIMEMQKPFTLRKPTLENYFDKKIINQYLS